MPKVYIQNLGYKIARAARRTDFSRLFLFWHVYTELVLQQTYVNMCEEISAPEKIWRVRATGFSKFRESSIWELTCWSLSTGTVVQGAKYSARHPCSQIRQVPMEKEENCVS